jgi:hypothetical protein
VFKTIFDIDKNAGIDRRRALTLTGKAWQLVDARRSSAKRWQMFQPCNRGAFAAGRETTGRARAYLET